MWSLKMIVTFVSLWGDTVDVEVVLRDAFYSEALCQTYRPGHEFVLAVAVVQGRITSPLGPLGRVKTTGTCVPPSPLPPRPFVVGIPV